MGDKPANGSARLSPGPMGVLFGFTDIYLSGVMWSHLHDKVDDVLGSCWDMPRLGPVLVLVRIRSVVAD